MSDFFRSTVYDYILQQNPFLWHWYLFIPPENMKKLEDFWCFQGLQREISDMKWVNLLLRRKCSYHKCSLNVSCSYNPLKNPHRRVLSLLKSTSTDNGVILKNSTAVIFWEIPQSNNILYHISTDSAAKVIQFSHDVIWTAIRCPYYVLQHVIYEGSWRVRLDLMSGGRLIWEASRWSSLRN